jgi:hypothetical protein
MQLAFLIMNVIYENWLLLFAALLSMVYGVWLPVIKVINIRKVKINVYFTHVVRNRIGDRVPDRDTVLYIVHSMESINKWRVLSFDCSVPPSEITSLPIHLGNMADVRCAMSSFGSLKRK